MEEVTTELFQMFEGKQFRTLLPWNWPARSPDLKPLDFLLVISKRNVYMSRKLIYDMIYIIYVCQWVINSIDKLISQLDQKNHKYLYKYPNSEMFEKQQWSFDCIFIVFSGHWSRYIIQSIISHRLQFWHIIEKMTL